MPRCPTLLFLAVATLLSSAPVQAQDRPITRKLSKSEVSDARELVILADMAIKGLSVPGGMKLTFQNHFLKTGDGKTYVPFTINLTQAERPTRNVGLYVRVAIRNDTKLSAERTARLGDVGYVAEGFPVFTAGRGIGQGRPNPAGQASAAFRLADKQRDTDPYPFEDFHFIEWPDTAEAEGRRIDRALVVAPGSYDLYLAVKERGAAGRAAATLKIPLEVPDFATPRLTISDIIVAERVQPLERPLSVGEQIKRPYALGTLEIVPARQQSFVRTSVLNLVFFVYNTGQDDGKPDLRLDYVFFRDEGEAPPKPVAQFPPQVFAADTLPEGFDLRKGQAVIPTLEIALQSFEPGRYRLEINAVDNMAMATTTQSFFFSVVQP